MYYTLDQVLYAYLVSQHGLLGSYFRQIRDKDSSLAHAGGSADGSRCPEMWTSDSHSVAAFGTVKHHIHRRRRTPISSFFSKTSVADMQDKIWAHAEHLCDILREHHEKGTVVYGRQLFLGWSTDTLKACAFGPGESLLDDVEQTLAFDQIFESFATLYPLLKQCEWMIPFALTLPIWLTRALHKPLATLLIVHKVSSRMEFSFFTRNVLTSRG